MFQYDNTILFYSKYVREEPSNINERLHKFVEWKQKSVNIIMLQIEKSL